MFSEIREILSFIARYGDDFIKEFRLAFILYTLAIILITCGVTWGVHTALRKILKRDTKGLRIELEQLRQKLKEETAKNQKMRIELTEIKQARENDTVDFKIWQSSRHSDKQHHKRFEKRLEEEFSQK